MASIQLLHSDTVSALSSYCLWFSRRLFGSIITLGVKGKSNREHSDKGKSNDEHSDKGKSNHEHSDKGKSFLGSLVQVIVDTHSKCLMDI